MRNKDRLLYIARMLESTRFEVFPAATVVDKVLEGLPVGRTVTVTASPSQGLEATLATAEKLAGYGYDTVPHIAARMVSGRGQLAEITSRLHEAGITTVFVPGGDQEPAAGDYHSALDLLRDLSQLGNPALRVGITGYPETHPSISDDLMVQSMWDKRKHASHVVSNLTFDPSLLGQWVMRLRERGMNLPVMLGVPGPIDRAKLLSMATKIGVGDSTRFLAKNKGIMARLAAPGGFTGEKFLESSAVHLAAPSARVTGLHLYTFNQVAATEKWRKDYFDRINAQL